MRSSKTSSELLLSAGRPKPLTGASFDGIVNPDDKSTDGTPFALKIVRVTDEHLIERMASVAAEDSEVAEKLQEAARLLVAHTVKNMLPTIVSEGLRRAVDVEVRRQIDALGPDIEAQVQATIAARWKNDVGPVVEKKLRDLIQEVGRRVQGL